MAQLVFYRDEARLVEYRLASGRTSIGRADTCDIALPGSHISRTHCIIDGDGDSWQVIDRSRHGITVDGAPVRRAELRDGSRIGLGDYTIEVRLERQVAAPTDEAIPERSHEVILATDDGHLRVEGVSLVVIEGPDAGRSFPLRSPRLSVGAPPSDLRLRDPALEPDHLHLRVVRGRVMVAPGTGATWLDGARIREITPLYVDDELSFGQTVARIQLDQRDETPVAARFGDMVGQTPQMQQLFGTLRRFAGHHFPVLITGESGTGKELAARGIHQCSARATGPFIPLNCSAIATELFESELFGHEKGAFTGADRRKDGAFHRAGGGTLFLDEIGELPEAAQAKLLRALESGEVRRIGGTEVQYPDVRVIAATNRDLVEEAARGRFREDLYYRLAVLSVRLPPLRDRLADLEPICAVLCRGLHPDARVTEDALALLRRHRWPGNIRELRNVLTRAYVMAGPVIDAQALSFHDIGRPAPPPRDTATLRDAERAYIQQVLAQHGGNRSAAARALGIARSTLHYKLQRLGLS
ncbi:MAG: FHA domain-containing protein [Deltaproteobacteria bacterium]|nr:MAG: FHA domain-containing protein [Deltaproteobacteria bacterium]